MPTAPCGRSATNEYGETLDRNGYAPSIVQDIEGMKSGVADIFLPAPSGEYHGLFIELKRLRGGKRTEKQEEFIAAMNAAGYCACFCAGWMAAAEVIVGYLEGDFTWKQ